MTGFDFFVDLAVTGTVLGLDRTSTPGAVRAVFGGEVGEFSSFIEFGWSGRDCLYFGAQAHRLDLLNRDGLLEPVLTRRYGPFPDRVDVDALREAVAAKGFPNGLPRLRDPRLADDPGRWITEKPRLLAD